MTRAKPRRKAIFFAGLAAWLALSKGLVTRAKPPRTLREATSVRVLASRLGFEFIDHKNRIDR